MNTHIAENHIRSAVCELPEMAVWPEVASLLAIKGDRVRLDWQLPVLACRAVSSEGAIALPASAAIACLQISIILADDMLDQDPRGQYRRMGSGRTANLALAFQAAALTLIGRAPVAPEIRAVASTALAQAALTTAAGQELDVRNLQGEESYWQVVRTKSTPFYGVALQLGALLAGAGPDVAQGMYDLGVLVGEMIQVYDDLVDAFQAPANPDWREGRNNLAILYASTAAHPEREQFTRLLASIDDSPALEEAQRILIRSGAVSFCIYHIVQRYRAARGLLERLPLMDPAPLSDMLTHQAEPLAQWLRGIGIAVPPELSGGTA